MTTPALEYLRLKVLALKLRQAQELDAILAEIERLLPEDPCRGARPRGEWCDIAKRRIHDGSMTQRKATVNTNK